MGILTELADPPGRVLEELARLKTRLDESVPPKHLERNLLVAIQTLVRFAVRDQQAKLRWHARKLPLEGLSDKLCLAVLDILHQGRASYRTIRSALREGDTFDALLSIGLGSYRERRSTLRAGILDLERRGLVGERVYSGRPGTSSRPRAHEPPAREDRFPDTLLNSF